MATMGPQIWSLIETILTENKFLFCSDGFKFNIQIGLILNKKKRRAVLSSKWVSEYISDWLSLTHITILEISLLFESCIFIVYRP